MEKMLFTAEETAQALGIGRTKVYDLIARAQIESVLIGKSRRVPRQAVENYVERIRNPRSGAA